MGLEAFILSFIDRLFTIYYILIIARILMSWLRFNLQGVFKQIYDFVYVLTEPYLALFRNILPNLNLGGMGLDISPIIALFVLRFIQGFTFMIINFIFSLI